MGSEIGLRIKGFEESRKGGDEQSDIKLDG